jgi:hypothetical protein
MPGFWHRASSAIRTRNRITTRLATLSRDHHGPRTVLNVVERLAGGYGSECVRVRQNLSVAEAQLRDYQARLGKPFVHDTYLAELTTMRDQLKAGLPGAAHEPGKEEGPSVSELSKPIKALKTAHSIKAKPQRNRQKHSSAEEPVTARIRRRVESSSASDSAAETEAVPRAKIYPTRVSHDRSSTRTQLTFQERIILERQRKDDGPSPR